MSVIREFTIRLEDRPGTLAKICEALAGQNVNILAFQASPAERGKCSVRLVVDDPTRAKSVLEKENADLLQADVVQVRLAHRPGELARAASRLKDKGINIDYAYMGAEAGSNAPILIFGVGEAGQASKVLEQVAAAATR